MTKYQVASTVKVWMQSLNRVILNFFTTVQCTCIVLRVKQVFMFVQYILESKADYFECYSAIITVVTIPLFAAP